jgi:hypothetical protein
VIGQRTGSTAARHRSSQPNQRVFEGTSTSSQQP